MGYFYPKNYYKLIGKDLSILKNMIILQQNNFVGKLEDNGAVMFLIAEKEQMPF